MSSDIEFQIKVKMKGLECYSLTLDKNTDIRNKAQLAAFTRTVDKDFNVLEELFDFNSMKATTRAIDIF